MPSPDEIQHQQTLLAAHRRTLAHLLNQQATFGMAYVPPHVSSGIDEARTQIARIKVALRSWHAPVEDLPSDVPAMPVSIAAPLPAPGITIHGGTFHGPVGQSGGSMFNQHYEHVDNVYNIAGSLNLAQSPGKDEFLAALRAFKAEVEKAKDLPELDAADIEDNVQGAIRTVDRAQPDKPRLADKLQSAKKVLDGLTGSTQSALALGALLGELLSKVPLLPF